MRHLAEATGCIVVIFEKNFVASQRYSGLRYGYYISYAQCCLKVALYSRQMNAKILFAQKLHSSKIVAYMLLFTMTIIFAT